MGTLYKTGWDNWLLKVNGISYVIHQQHNLWLMFFGKEGAKFNFEKDRGGVVILKSIK